MSEAPVSTRRIGTRAVIRQENAAMAMESEAASSEADPSKDATPTSPPPKGECKMGAAISPKGEGKTGVVTSPPRKRERKTSATTPLSPRGERRTGRTTSPKGERKRGVTNSAKGERKKGGSVLGSPKGERKSAATTTPSLKLELKVEQDDDLTAPPPAKVKRDDDLTDPPPAKVKQDDDLNDLPAAKVKRDDDLTDFPAPAVKRDNDVSPSPPPMVLPKLEPKEEPKDEPGDDFVVEMKSEPEDNTDDNSGSIILTRVLTGDEATDGASTSLTPTGAVPGKDAMVLQPLGQGAYTGRKRKANFSNEETDTLVKYVVRHFSALYGSEALRTESTRRNQRRSQLWHQIQKHVNDLGYTQRSIDDLKHKWRDLRLEVKRKITHRKTARKANTNPDVTPIIDTRLTPTEDLVASTIGHHCSLDGEQEGLYIEPGGPRQSIFFNCRGSPGAPMPELSTDKHGTASPRPNSELSLLSPVISTSPATLSFIVGDDRGSDDDFEMDVTSTITPSDAPSTAQPAVTTDEPKANPTITTTPSTVTTTQPTAKPTVTASLPTVTTSQITVKAVVTTSQISVKPVVSTSQISVKPVVSTSQISVKPVVSTSQISVKPVVSTSQISVKPVVSTSQISVKPVVSTSQISVKPVVSTSQPTVATSQITIKPTLSITSTQSTVKPTVTLTICQPAGKTAVPLSIGQGNFTPTVSMPLTLTKVTPTVSMPLTLTKVTPTVSLPLTLTKVSPTVSLPLALSKVTPTGSLPLALTKVTPTLAFPVSQPPLSLAPKIAFPVGHSAVTLQQVSLPTLTQTIAHPKITVHSLPTVKDLATLVASQTVLPPIRSNSQTPQIFTVKQEPTTGQPILVPSRCNSQNSIVSSPEGSVSHTPGPITWTVNGGTDNSASEVGGDIKVIKLKMEDDEEGGCQGSGGCSPTRESQDEWDDAQSGSPHPSENAPEDSLPSTSSQDEDHPTSTNELSATGGCSCGQGNEGKEGEVKAKMQRLLELEERWDRLYDRELGMWEEERTQQQQQRAQDRELQQQLLGVLTDIRDELRQLRQERATARLNQPATPAAEAPTDTTVTASPTTAAASPKTPKASRVASKRSSTSMLAKRKGRPRLLKSPPDPVEPTQPPSPNS